MFLYVLNVFENNVSINLLKLYFTCRLLVRKAFIINNISNNKSLSKNTKSILNIHDLHSILSTKNCKLYNVLTVVNK